MSGPLALVYRGPASLPGCPEAVGELLENSGHDLDVRFTGPGEHLQLSPATLQRAVLYAQPGGGELEPAYRRMRQHARVIRSYVRSGGLYLGFCLGGYLAGATPGYRLLPGDTDQYIAAAGALTTSEADTVLPVDWRGRRQHVYFQDGPYFWLRSGVRDVTVLARYTNGRVAALVVPCGAGTVAVVGPHPEATADWYAEQGLPLPDGAGHGLGQDFVETALRAVREHTSRS